MNYNNSIYREKYLKYKNKYLELKKGGAAEIKEAKLKNAVVGTIREVLKKNKRGIISEEPSKKITRCISAAKINKYQLKETYGTETNKFIIFRSADGEFGESSFLISEPRLRSNGIEIACETNNTIYIIPEQQFYDGNKIIKKILTIRK